MNEKKVFLSKTSVKMIDIIVDKAREMGCKVVNTFIFLYGLIELIDENGKTSPLYDYFIDSNASPSEIGDIMEVNLLPYYEVIKEVKDNNSKKNSGKEETKKEKEEEKVEEKNNESESDKGKEKDLSSIDQEPNDSKKSEESEKDKKSKKQDFEAAWTFDDEKGKEHRIIVDEEVFRIFTNLIKLLKDSEISKIEPVHFIIAMFITDSKLVRGFFKELEISYVDAAKYFSKERILESEIFIPSELSGFLSVLNDRIDTSKPCEILMRDRETETLWNIMLKMNKRNAVIVGEPGVGKTALVEKITYEIKAETCPPEFKDFKVITLDVNSLIAGTSFRGDSELRIKNMIKFLEENPKIILFIDEVHTILGAGSTVEGGLDLSNALKPVLARGNTIVIGATTLNEYEMYFKSDAALSRRFERVDVTEPTPENVYPMIKNKIKHLSKFHKVRITPKMVEYVIMIAGCFAFEKKNPDKTLDLLDRAMVTAKRNGKNKVDKESVLDNFGIYFKMWDNMSEDSRKEVAYHELGHYIMCKASDKLIEYDIQAVSIMPAEGYLGVTVFNINYEKVPFANLDYYIDVIAEDLAGRVAESFFRKTFTAGASSDLNNATRTAFMVVTKLGMGSDSIKNRIYLNSVDYPMFTEKSTNIINDEVNKLIEKAFNRATKVIEENKDILEAMVYELLEKKIMSETELDIVWQRVLRRRKRRKK